MNENAGEGYKTNYYGLEKRSKFVAAYLHVLLCLYTMSNNSQ
jgi:hypothetical protein